MAANVTTRLPHTNKAYVCTMVILAWCQIRTYVRAHIPTRRMHENNIHTHLHVHTMFVQTLLRKYIHTIQSMYLHNLLTEFSISLSTNYQQTDVDFGRLNKLLLNSNNNGLICMNG